MALNLGMTPLLAALCLGFCCVVNGRSLFDFDFGNDLENMNNKKVLMHQFGERPDDINGCSCNKTGCQCCQIIDIPDIQFHKNCCFGIQYISGANVFMILIQVGDGYEILMWTGAGNLPSSGGCISPRVNIGVIGFQLEILKNSTSGLSACPYLAMVKPPLVPMGCFNFNYTSKVQSDDLRLDSETVENDLETVYQSKELYMQMKRNDVDNLNNQEEVGIEMDEFTGRREEGYGCSCNKTGCFCCQIVDIPDIKFRENCCFIITFYRPYKWIELDLQIGQTFELDMATTVGDLPFIGACLSPRVNNSVVGYQLEIQKNSTSGFSACVYLGIVKPPLIPMGCFTLNYTSSVQGDDNVQDFHQDSETVENDLETVYERKELYTQMKRSLFMNSRI